MPEVALLIDMDGVIYRDKEPIEGSIEFLMWLDEVQIPYLLVTNNSYYSSEELRHRLRRRGIDLSEDKLFTSVDAIREYLTGASRDALVIGSPGLLRAVQEAGLKLIEPDEVWDGARPAYLIVGYDRDLTYRKLAAACLLLNHSPVTYVATNSDRTFPTPKGLIPGAGATLEYLRACSGKEPLVVGKPNAMMAKLALERLRARGINPDEIWVIGDRLESDMAFAEAIRRELSLEVKSVLVLSGVTSEVPESPQWRVNMVLDKLADLRHEESFLKHVVRRVRANG